MIPEKSKKNNGIKFLKVEPHLFTKAVKLYRKVSYNPKMNIKEEQIEKKQTRKKSFNPNKGEEEKTPYNSTSITKENFKIYSPKKTSMKLNELLMFKKSLLKIEEEKNGGEMLLNKFSKTNLKPLKLIKNISSKNIIPNKSIIINNIITTNNPNNKNNTIKNLNKSQINLNDFNNKSEYKTSYTDNNNKEKIYQREKNKKNENNFKKLFCCL